MCARRARGFGRKKCDNAAGEALRCLKVRRTATFVTKSVLEPNGRASLSSCAERRSLSVTIHESSG